MLDDRIRGAGWVLAAVVAVLAVLVLVAYL